MFLGDKELYPEGLNVAGNGRMVSLLINDRGDFVSVEFKDHKVRDVFCLLVNKLRDLRKNSKLSKVKGK
jgi:hypothetical protein